MVEVYPSIATRLRPLTVDAHVDIPWIMQKHGPFPLALNNQGQRSMLDFPRMLAGGLNAAVFALYLSDGLQDTLGEKGSLKALLNQAKILEEDQPGLMIVDNAQSAGDAIDEGKVPIFLGLEGGRVISPDISLLSTFRDIGVKYLTVTHNQNTVWADSATDTAKLGGLSRFGRDVVGVCNRVGILLDVSHASDRTAHDVIEESVCPVIASHSGCRSLVNHPRNIPDDLIKDIAETGGVVHIPFANRFVGQNWRCVVDHIDHVIQMVGTSHVGIGSDLDGAVMTSGVPDVTVWRRVVMQQLAKKGYSDSEIADISGMNTLRVFG